MLRKCSFFTLLFLFTWWGGVPSFKELVGSRCDPGESSCWELAGCLPGGGGVHIYECECAPAVGVWVRIEGFWGGLVVWVSIRRRLVHLFFLQAYTYKKRKKMQGRKVSSSTSSMASYSPATVCRRHCCRAQSFSYLRNTKLMKSE